MKRRRKVLSDSDIRFKTTSTEKNELQVYCFRNDISVSELTRQAINFYTKKRIFVEQEYKTNIYENNNKTTVSTG